MIIIFYLANIVYDMQAIKKEINESEEDNEDNLAIIFALGLYLSFYYLFLDLLRLLRKLKNLKK